MQNIIRRQLIVQFSVESLGDQYWVSYIAETLAETFSFHYLLMKIFNPRKSWGDPATLQLPPNIFVRSFVTAVISILGNAWICEIWVCCLWWQQDMNVIKFKTHILQVHLYLHVVRRGKVERTHPTDVIKIMDSPKSDGQIFDRRSTSELLKYLRITYSVKYLPITSDLKLQ